jgi:hypothetical protein
MSDTPETDKNVSVGLENADRECVPVDFSRKLERERDEARAERDILKLDAQREAEHHDRMVGELEKVYKERDEAREALMQIEDLFIDGTDIYADREKMGTIARAALEGAQ